MNIVEEDVKKFLENNKDKLPINDTKIEEIDEIEENMFSSNEKEENIDDSYPGEFHDNHDSHENPEKRIKRKYTRRNKDELKDFKEQLNEAVYIKEDINNIEKNKIEESLVEKNEDSLMEKMAKRLELLENQIKERDKIITDIDKKQKNLEVGYQRYGVSEWKDLTNGSERGYSRQLYVDIKLMINPSNRQMY